MASLTSDQAYQRLYAILLGEPPYDRYGAPEPGLLLELVPVLPDDVLAEAVWGVAGIGVIWPTQRLRLLAALLERVSLADPAQADLLAQAVIQIPDVIPYLPESVLPRTLSAVRAFEWWDEPARATALASLSARSPEPSLQDVLAAARAPIDYGDRGRAPALAEAISKLGGPLADKALSELLAAARAMGRGNDRGMVFVALLSRLDESARGPAVFEALAAFRSDDQRTPQRVGALAVLSRQLPEPLRSQVRDQAVGEARALDAQDERARALIAVAQELSVQPVNEPLARELMDEIHSLDIPEFDLIPLAPYLSEAQLSRALETLPYEPVMMEGVLIDLAPYLPERLLAEALGRGEDDASRLAVFRALAPRLPPPLLDEALGMALSLEGRWEREQALAALWPFLSEDLRQRARLPEAGPLPTEQVRELWVFLSQEQQVTLAENVIHATCDYYGGAEAAALEPEPEPEPAPAPPPLPESPGGEEVWRGIEEPGGEGGPEPKGLPTEERLVNTGFSTPSRAGLPVDPVQPLAPGRAYYFWFQVGRRVAGAIDVADVALPVELLPVEARLTVALYAFEGELRITPGQDVGEIQVQRDLSVRVVRPVEPAGAPDTVWPEDPLLEEQCLFFPIATPDELGLHRLRCNVYYEGLLVQSHLVQATVVAPGDWPRPAAGAPALSARALTARCDYTLSNTLRPEVLTRLEPHRLSLMINDNGDGTHGFRFFGADQVRAGDSPDQERPEPFKQDATIDGQALQNLINVARGALRKASWGDTDPWDWRKMYRYGQSAVRGGRLDSELIAQVQSDLIHLAKRGYSFYVATINELAAGGARTRREIREQRQKLEALMARPGGLIQIAAKESARHVVPLALFYDYRLNDADPDDAFSVCPAFLNALQARDPLGETDCFQGNCPSRGQRTVVCPSGFWGYRHGIGMPVSIGGSLDDVVTEIVYHGAPQMTVAVSTDDSLRLRADHEKTLRALRADVGWHYADSREETLDLMETAPSHVVYFYCHGGVTEENLPYIEVGPAGEGRITSGLIHDLFWDQPQPLVFINGCHTTDLEPEVAFNLVETFVETVGAAGVIGTEITIYEPLAVAFGEACLKRFMDGTPIGEAVRLARLELLQQGNPLGLVYDAYAVASLKMVPAS